MTLPYFSKSMFTAMAVLCLSATPLLNGCVSKSAYDAAQNEYEAVSKEKQALSSNNRLLLNRVRELEQENHQIKSQLHSVQDRLGEKSTVLMEKEEKLKSTSVQLSVTSEELESRERQLKLASMALEEKEAYLQELREKEAANRKIYEGLVNQLNTELAANQVRIEQMKDGISLNLSQEILFDSGSAELNKDGIIVLRKVSTELKDLAYQTVVSGHTDNVPISGKLAAVYPSNWDLAGARASRVVDLLEKEGVGSDKLVAVSFGEHRPVASNDTVEGRSQNRRIEIRLRPME